MIDVYLIVESGGAKKIEPEKNLEAVNYVRDVINVTNSEWENCHKLCSCSQAMDTESIL